MPTPRRTAALRLALLAAPWGIAGCGAEAYQSRIETNSIPLFGYKAELDSSLGPRWQKGEVAISMPAAFKEVPGPKVKKGAAPTGRDPRLPPGFVMDEIPGLLGGFRGTMRTEPAGGTAKDVPVYAFVTSNRYLLASREPTVKPAQYDATLLTSIAAGLRLGSVSITTLKPHSPTDSLGADQRPFAPGLRFDHAAFDTVVDDVPMKYEIYVRREAPLQVGVVFAVPKNAARDEQVRKRIDLSLQTLRIQPGGAGGRAATAPPASSAASDSAPTGSPGSPGSG